MRPGIKERRENCIMHKRSHLEPKKSIWPEVSKTISNAIDDSTYLGLKKTALEQYQRLPLEFMNQFPKAHAEVLISISLVVEEAPNLFICKALLKPSQNLNVGKLLLGEPGLCHNAEALTEHTKELGAVGNDHDGLLNGRACYVGRAVDELLRVELPCA